MRAFVKRSVRLGVCSVALLLVFGYLRGDTALQGQAPPPPCTQSCTLWNGITPTGTAFTDTNAIELGVKFSSDTGGYITGIRFYKLAANTGTHTGRLWDANGTVLAAAVFTNESASGWQTVT